MPTANCQLPTANCPAFTLIELLMVVMIIAVLFSILLSAIRTVERHTLQTVTQAEIRNIENAWKQYFAHYQMWPTNPPDNCIDARYADVLRGREPDTEDKLNPDGIIFMEFTRFAKLSTSDEEIPVNAWGESGRHKPEDCAFYVMFDDDGDNQLEVAPGSGYTTTNIFRSVVVWSFNPAQTEQKSDNAKLLGSWMQ
jgi:prepilin-type N-terminal cleavage/methylation domain-containing protein